MSVVYPFAVAVVRAVGERLASKAPDLRSLTETTCSFEEWVNCEAFLACKQCEGVRRYCEVTAKPTYASEQVESQEHGNLRVGGPNDGADHCWLFAEIVLLHDGNWFAEWRETVSADVEKLLRLGWKKSAAVLLVVSVSLGEQPAGWVESAVGGRQPLSEPFAFALPGGGTAVVTAFDIKRNPADTLTAAAG